MIALLAAVPEETALIRETIEASVQETVSGMAMQTGRIHGLDVCLAHGGIGKAAAAAATISLLQACQPEALVLFGCGGAYPNSGLNIGDLALADTEIFGDEGVATRHGFEDLAAMGLPMRKGDEPFSITGQPTHGSCSLHRPRCSTGPEKVAENSPKALS